MAESKETGNLHSKGIARVSLVPRNSREFEGSLFCSGLGACFCLSAQVYQAIAILMNYFECISYISMLFKLEIIKGKIVPIKQIKVHQ
jgi:hypothetical protein